MPFARQVGWLETSRFEISYAARRFPRCQTLPKDSRNTHRDFAHFLDIARGSCIEVQSLLYVALDAGYVTNAEFEKLYEGAQATASLIGRLTSHLRNRRAPSPEMNG